MKKPVKVETVYYLDRDFGDGMLPVVYSGIYGNMQSIRTIFFSGQSLQYSMTTITSASKTITKERLKGNPISCIEKPLHKSKIALSLA